DQAFATAAVNNVLYAVGTIVPAVAIALGLALMLRRSNTVNTLFRTLFFFPTLVPLVAAAALFLFIFLPGIGLLDHYLARLGAQSTNWLGDPHVALGSIVLITVWKNAGYYMLFFLAGLQGMPEDAEEAALIEGAHALQRFWYVTLPYLRPTIGFVAVIALINAVTQVDHVIVMTQGGPNNATNLVLYYIYQNAHEFWDQGKATAATVVSLAALLVLSAASLRTLERGVHYEAD
ncbi:MAG TPA: sugar ABC transporter permease, partial [Alphaproteobacteria bacterium]|nr:sugar ABC transporter permease [Alphaproteobacteria bacterium]